PLSVVEEPEKQMLGGCFDEERRCGILWLADDELKDIGCAAHITRVLEQFDDGRMTMLAEATTPFRMERRIGDLAYPAGDVVLLDDEPDADDAALERTRTTYAALVEEVTDSRPEPETLSALGAYGMAATVDINPAAKQKLLELRSEPARLQELEGLFSASLR